MRVWAAELAGIPEWLLEESYGAVGDSAEAAALLLPPADEAADYPLHWWLENRVLALRDLDEASQRAVVLEAWAQLDDAGRLVFNKLITGAFRVGVSQRLLTRALAETSQVDAAARARLFFGPVARNWSPLVTRKWPKRPRRCPTAR